MDVYTISLVERGGEDRVIRIQPDLSSAKAWCCDHGRTPLQWTEQIRNDVWRSAEFSYWKWWMAGEGTPGRTLQYVICRWTVGEEE
jgi:hypothetical protein